MSGADRLDSTVVSSPDAPSTPSRPVRTCIGCRQRAAKSDLVRLVAVGDGDEIVVVPDLRGAAPGRGAHLHPRVSCLEQATRRRAFTRALRTPGPVDTSLVAVLVESEQRRHHSTAEPASASTHVQEERSSRS
ncbi:YlxR family protein [Solicola sp. PLA-1-18]|uniref:YlxR family protein n=1 Tax=Solicola sp. PLA-1-18 TaxID=3380532 RepID=UPI003B796E41